jgi:hypothetical protein
MNVILCQLSALSSQLSAFSFPRTVRAGRLKAEG